MVSYTPLFCKPEKAKGTAEVRRVRALLNEHMD